MMMAKSMHQSFQSLLHIVLFPAHPAGRLKAFRRPADYLSAQAFLSDCIFSTLKPGKSAKPRSRTIWQKLSR